MPSSPTPVPQETTHPVSSELGPEFTVQDDDLFFEPPSSEANTQPVRRAKKFAHSGLKGKARLEAVEGAPCYLLDLPEDVLHLLLVRLPPRTLLQIGSTCKLLHNALKGEAMWRQCYINHFLWDGAATDGRAREEVKVLAQGCLGTGGRGWKREALSRESMIERWTASRTSNVVHHPVNVLVHDMSLAYPPNLPNAKGPLVVGKMTKAANGSGTSSPAAATPGKMTHRQRYEATQAVSARSPPTLYSVGLEVSALVKSDPLTGKVSKGFWGPGQDANFHIRPHWDPSSAPSATFIPRRSQTHMLWGLLTGSTVHTTIQSRSHATHGGRPNSVNVYSKPNDQHLGAIFSIHQPESTGVDPMKWATAGEDGRVKYWRLNPGAKSGKKTPTDPATITCLFTSEVVEATFLNRSEEVRLRQTLQPDPITKVVCDVQYDIVCGVTEDGDMRVWFDVAGEQPREVRVDVGAAADFGGVKRLFMTCRDGNASIVVHHDKHPNFGRYDIAGDGTVKTTFYGTHGEIPLSTVQPYFSPALPIAKPHRVESTLTVVTPTSGSTTPTPLELDDLPRKLTEPEFGRFVVGGDINGQAYIWDWEGRTVDDVVMPMRDWVAQDGKITAVDYSCGLVAVGSYSGHYDVFDPLPNPPERLRGFRPPGHLTPGDLMLAGSDEFRSRYYNVNHIILDNDLILAAIGRNVQTWRAGTGKGRQSGKDSAPRKGTSGGKGDFRQHRQLDLRDLHQDAVDSHYEIQAENDAHRPQMSHEEQHLAAMEDLGLADGDAALQYALMLSQQEQEQEQETRTPGPESPSEESDEEAEAIRAVEEFERRQAAQEAASSAPDNSSFDASDEETEAIRAVQEYERGGDDEGDAPDDLAEILEMIRLAEERERSM